MLGLGVGLLGFTFGLLGLRFRDIGFGLKHFKAWVSCAVGFEF